MSTTCSFSDVSLITVVRRRLRSTSTSFGVLLVDFTVKWSSRASRAIWVADKEGTMECQYLILSRSLANHRRGAYVGIYFDVFRSTVGRSHGNMVQFIWLLVKS